MKFIEILFVGLIFSLGIAQLGAITVGPFANMFVHDQILLLLIAVFLYVRMFVKKSLVLPRLVFPIVLFLIWAFIALILGSFQLSLSLREFTFSFLYLLRLVAYIFVFLIVFNLLKENKKFLNTLLKSFLSLNIAISLIGLFQLIFFPNLGDLTIFSGWDPHKGRLFSTFLDPNFVGAFFALNLILALILYKSDYWPKNDFRKIILVGIGLPATALSFTLSRSAWLLFSVASLVLGFFKSKFYWWFAIGFLVFTFLFVPQSLGRFAGFMTFLIPGGEFERRIEEIDESAYARFGSWQRGILFALEKPVYGFGFNTLRYASLKFGFFSGVGDLGGRAGAGVDSSLLFILATTGIVGLILYLYLIFTILKDSFKALQGKSGGGERKTFGFLVFSALIGLLVESNFINSLFYPQIVLWLFSLLGVFYYLIDGGVKVTKLSDLKSFFRAYQFFNKLKPTKSVK